ncbi:hypothetical protein Hypma_003031 [Hypsizygus marmoreus]|uniref:Uncharacterized protein n=1 Tax=Hypsizygus marmoreus TaxID=39966 RepID=A0A369JA31_HYPMA|nr:hypothetical protein Hypma_003031 [Hypsizygus marmoreus]
MPVSSHSHLAPYPTVTVIIKLLPTSRRSKIQIQIQIQIQIPSGFITLFSGSTANSKPHEELTIDFDTVLYGANVKKSPPPHDLGPAPTSPALVSLSQPTRRDRTFLQQRNPS